MSPARTPKDSGDSINVTSLTLSKQNMASDTAPAFVPDAPPSVSTKTDGNLDGAWASILYTIKKQKEYSLLATANT